MSTATFTDSCPYPGCALEQEHGGDHVPRVRLVQRYAKYNAFSSAMHPGFCEVGECRGTVVAIYQTFDGKSVEVCDGCKDDLIKFGWTELGKEGAA